MGDYGAWQVALWQNADVVLFFLKTDYYCKFILKFAALTLSLHKKTKSVRFFASGDDFYTSSDVCLSYLGLLFRVGCLLQGGQVRAATDCLRT